MPEAGGIGAAVVHIFRFDDDRIVELWDIGQAVPEASVNENGMFRLRHLNHSALTQGAPAMQTVSTCLWFDDQAQEAVAFYTSIFPNSRIIDTKYYLEGAAHPAGTVLIIQFVLDGTEYLALNGGPHFKFSPAVSLVAYCDTQDEVDTLWRKLTEGGQESQCGWLTDRYGLSWQIVPRPMLALLNTSDSAASQRAFSAMMTMKKLDIATLRRAYHGPDDSIQRATRTGEFARCDAIFYFVNSLLLINILPEYCTYLQSSGEPHGRPCFRSARPALDWRTGLGHH